MSEFGKNDSQRSPVRVKVQSSDSGRFQLIYCVTQCRSVWIRKGRSLCGWLSSKNESEGKGDTCCKFLYEGCNKHVCSFYNTIQLMKHHVFLQSQNVKIFWRMLNKIQKPKREGGGKRKQKVMFQTTMIPESQRLFRHFEMSSVSLQLSNASCKLQHLGCVHANGQTQQSPWAQSAACNILSWLKSLFTGGWNQNDVMQVRHEVRFSARCMPSPPTYFWHDKIIGSQWLSMMKKHRSDPD